MRKRCSWLALAVLNGALLAGLAGAQEMSPQGNPYATVTVRGVTVKAEVVSTPAKVFMGLGYRTPLPEGTGMLFVMPQKEIQRFCMRGMLFALDFFWIEGGRVVGLEKNVRPDDDRTLASPVPVRLVLEVPAGFADRHNLKVGDQVLIIP